MRPERRIRRPPHDLIPRHIRIPARLPAKLALIAEHRRIDRHARRRSRCICQTVHGRRVNHTNTLNELKIAVLREIAVLRAVAHDDVLVLVAEVLLGLGEARCRKPGGEEGLVITATEVAVRAVDDGDVHLRVGVASDFSGEAGELSGGRVGVAADGLARGGDGGALGGRRALGEEADGVGVLGAVFAGRGADDVVGEHALHVDGGVFVGEGLEVAAVEALLFAGDDGEDDS